MSTAEANLALAVVFWLLMVGTGIREARHGRASILGVVVIALASLAVVSAAPGGLPVVVETFGVEAVRQVAFFLRGLILVLGIAYVVRAWRLP